jgi:MarR family transcriptional regulator, organic hydroperoxide resistance regulator
VDEGDVVGAELAARTSVSPAAVSQLFTALEAAGLVERGRLPGDRRRQPLALTERGERTLHTARAELMNGLAPLLADLPAPEADALVRLLARLEASFGGTAPPRRPRRPPPPPPRRPRPRP